MKMMELLKAAVEKRASDIHIMAGVSPILRVHGEIVATDFEPLTSETAEKLIMENLTPEKIEVLERDLQLCYSLKVPELGYFRTAVYYEQGTLGAAIRVGMVEIKGLEELGLPSILSELVRRPSGLILITGPTGSGKTTTLNSLIDIINRERRCKIIMVEDPIEYVHSNKRSVVVQQEIHTDTLSFSRALIHILRQDPNVIGVGEMRDRETIATALTAAETGHLVVSTLHTSDAPQTVDRIIDVFPADQQTQVRMQLANSLLAVVSQQLLPRVDTEGRVLATEMMISNAAVTNVVRENKVHALHNIIATGQRSGMHTMDSSLTNLYQQGIITYDTAITRAIHPEDMRLRESEPDPGVIHGLKKV